MEALRTKLQAVSKETAKGFESIQDLINIEARKLEKEVFGRNQTTLEQIDGELNVKRKALEDHQAFTEGIRGTYNEQGVPEEASAKAQKYADEAKDAVENTKQVMREIYVPRVTDIKGFLQKLGSRIAEIDPSKGEEKEQEANESSSSDF